MRPVGQASNQSRRIDRAKTYASCSRASAPKRLCGVTRHPTTTFYSWFCIWNGVLKFRCLIAALLLANPLVAQETVRLGTDAAYPPYSFLNPDEGLDGFEIELALALCAHAGLTCVWIKTPWDNLTSALEAGEIDAIMSALGPNRERAEIIAFSTPYHGNGSAAWLVRAGDSLRPGARIAKDRCKKAMPWPRVMTYWALTRLKRLSRRWQIAMPTQHLA
jgi:ABC-type amino acid transport substrate-binding protein